MVKIFQWLYVTWRLQSRLFCDTQNISFHDIYWFIQSFLSIPLPWTQRPNPNICLIVSLIDYISSYSFLTCYFPFYICFENLLLFIIQDLDWASSFYITSFLPLSHSQNHSFNSLSAQYLLIYLISLVPQFVLHYEFIKAINIFILIIIAIVVIMLVPLEDFCGLWNRIWHNYRWSFWKLCVGYNVRQKISSYNELDEMWCCFKSGWLWERWERSSWQGWLMGWWWIGAVGVNKRHQGFWPD